MIAATMVLLAVLALAAAVWCSRHFDRRPLEAARYRSDLYAHPREYGSVNRPPRDVKVKLTLDASEFQKSMAELGERVARFAGMVRPRRCLSVDLDESFPRRLVSAWKVLRG